jgi:hypothetical protein
MDPAFSHRGDMQQQQKNCKASKQMFDQAHSFFNRPLLLVFSPAVHDPC